MSICIGDQFVPVNIGLGSKSLDFEERVRQAAKQQNASTHPQILNIESDGGEIGAEVPISIPVIRNLIPVDALQPQSHEDLEDVDPFWSALIWTVDQIYMLCSYVRRTVGGMILPEDVEARILADYSFDREQYLAPGATETPDPVVRLLDSWAQYYKDILEGLLPDQFDRSEAEALAESFALAAQTAREVATIRHQAEWKRADSTKLLQDRLLARMRALSVGERLLVPYTWVAEGNPVLMLVEFKKGSCDEENEIAFYNSSPNLKGLFDAPDPTDPNWAPAQRRVFIGMESSILEPVLCEVLRLQQEPTNYHNLLTPFLHQLGFSGIDEVLSSDLASLKRRCEELEQKVQGMSDQQKQDFAKAMAEDTMHLLPEIASFGFSSGSRFGLNMMRGDLTGVDMAESCVADLVYSLLIKAIQPIDRRERLRDLFSFLTAHVTVEERIEQPGESSSDLQRVVSAYHDHRDRRSSKLHELMFSIRNFVQEYERTRKLNLGEAWGTAVIGRARQFYARAEAQRETLFGEKSASELADLSCALNAIIRDVRNTREVASTISQTLDNAQPKTRGELNLPAFHTQPAQTHTAPPVEPMLMLPDLSSASLTQMDGILEGCAKLCAEGKHSNMRRYVMASVFALPTDSTFWDGQDNPEAWGERIDLLGNYLSVSVLDRLSEVATGDISKWVVFDDELRAIVRTWCILDQLARNPRAPHRNLYVGKFDEQFIHWHLHYNPYVNSGDAVADHSFIADLDYLQKAGNADRYRFTFRGRRNSDGSDNLPDHELEITKAFNAGLYIDPKDKAKTRNLPPSINRLWQHRLRTRLILQPMGILGPSVGLDGITKTPQMLVAGAKALVTWDPSVLCEGIMDQFIHSCRGLQPLRAHWKYHNYHNKKRTIHLGVDRYGTPRTLPIEDIDVELWDLRFDPLPGWAVWEEGIETEGKILQRRVRLARETSSGGRPIKDKVFRTRVIEVPPSREANNDSEQKRISQVLSSGDTAYKDTKHALSRHQTLCMQLERVGRSASGMARADATSASLAHDITVNIPQNDAQAYSISMLPRTVAPSLDGDVADSRSMDSAVILAALSDLGNGVEPLENLEVQRELEQLLFRPGVLEVAALGNPAFCETFVQVLTSGIEQAKYRQDLAATLFLGSVSRRTFQRLAPWREVAHINTLCASLPKYGAMLDQLQRCEGQPWVDLKIDLLHQHWLLFYMSLHKSSNEIELLVDETLKALPKASVNADAIRRPDVRDLLRNQLQKIFEPGSDRGNFDIAATEIVRSLNQMGVLGALDLTQQGELLQQLKLRLQTVHEDEMAYRVAVLGSFAVYNSAAGAAIDRDICFEDRLARWMERNLRDWALTFPTDPEGLRPLLNPILQSLCPNLVTQLDDIRWEVEGSFPNFSTTHQDKKIQLRLSEGLVFINGVANGLLPSICLSEDYQKIFSRRRFFSEISTQGEGVAFKRCYRFTENNTRYEVQILSNDQVLILREDTRPDGKVVFFQYVREPLSKKDDAPESKIENSESTNTIVDPKSTDKKMKAESTSTGLRAEKVPKEAPKVDVGNLPGEIIGNRLWSGCDLSGALLLTDQNGQVVARAWGDEHGVDALQDSKGRLIRSLGPQDQLPNALAGLEHSSHIKVVENRLIFDRLGLQFEKPASHDDPLFLESIDFKGFGIPRQAHQIFDPFEDGSAPWMVLEKRTDPKERLVVMHGGEFVFDPSLRSPRLTHDPLSGNDHRDRLFTYQLRSDNSLFSEQPDANLWLAYVYMVQGQYQAAELYMERSLTGRTPTKFYSDCCRWICSFQSDSPDCMALQLHLISTLARRPQMKVLKDNDVCGLTDAQFLTLYRKYTALGRQKALARRFELPNADREALGRVVLQHLAGAQDEFISKGMAIAKQFLGDKATQRALGMADEEILHYNEQSASALAVAICAGMCPTATPATKGDSRRLLSHAHPDWVHDFPVIYKRLTYLENLKHSDEGRQELMSWLVALSVDRGVDGWKEQARAALLLATCWALDPDESEPLPPLTNPLALHDPTANLFPFGLHPQHANGAQVLEAVLQVLFQNKRQTDRLTKIRSPYGVTRAGPDCRELSRVILRLIARMGIAGSLEHNERLVEEMSVILKTLTDVGRRDDDAPFAQTPEEVSEQIISLMERYGLGISTEKQDLLTETISTPLKWINLNGSEQRAFCWAVSAAQLANKLRGNPKGVPSSKQLATEFLTTIVPAGENRDRVLSEPLVQQYVSMVFDQIFRETDLARQSSLIDQKVSGVAKFLTSEGYVTASDDLEANLAATLKDLTRRAEAQRLANRGAPLIPTFREWFRGDYDFDDASGPLADALCSRLKDLGIADEDLLSDPQIGQDILDSIKDMLTAEKGTAPKKVAARIIRSIERNGVRLPNRDHIIQQLAIPLKEIHSDWTARAALSIGIAAVRYLDTFGLGLEQCMGFTSFGKDQFKEMGEGLKLVIDNTRSITNNAGNPLSVSDIFSKISSVDLSGYFNTIKKGQLSAEKTRLKLELARRSLTVPDRPDPLPKQSRKLFCEVRCEVQPIIDLIQVVDDPSAKAKWDVEWRRHKEAIFGPDKYTKTHHRMKAHQLGEAYELMCSRREFKKYSILDMRAMTTRIRTLQEDLRKHHDRFGRELESLQLRCAPRSGLPSDVPLSLSPPRTVPVERLLSLWEQDRLAEVRSFYKWQATDEDLQAMSRVLERIALHKVWMNQLGNALKVIAEIQVTPSNLPELRSVLTKELRDLFVADHFYIPGHKDARLRRILAIEREELFIVREKQLDVTNLMIRRPEQAVQAAVGSGKSSVINKLVQALWADGRHLSVLVVTPEEYEETLKREDLSTRPQMGRPIVPFKFDQDSETTVESLATLHLQWMHAALDGGKVITTPPSLLVFRGRFVEKLLQSFIEENKTELERLNNELDAWGEIFVFVSENAPFLCDEMEKLLAITDMVNIGLKVLGYIDPSRRERGKQLLLKIYLDPELLRMMRLLTNEQRLLNLDQIRQISGDMAARFGADWGFSGKDLELLVQYLTITSTKAKTEPFRAEILETHPHFKDAVVLRQILQALPVIRQMHGVEVGRMPGSDDVGPYQGIGMPQEGTHIADPSEWSIAVYSNYALKGVTEGQLDRIVEEIKRVSYQAHVEREEEPALVKKFRATYSDPHSGKLIDPMNLSPEDRTRILKVINATPESKLQFASDFVLARTPFFSKQIRGNPQHTANLGMTCGGYSGTMASSQTFANNIRKDHNTFDPQFDGFLLMYGIEHLLQPGGCEYIGGGISQFTISEISKKCKSPALANLSVDEIVEWLASPHHIAQLGDQYTEILYWDQDGNRRIRDVGSRAGTDRPFNPSTVSKRTLLVAERGGESYGKSIEEIFASCKGSIAITDDAPSLKNYDVNQVVDWLAIRENMDTINKNFKHILYWDQRGRKRVRKVGSPPGDDYDASKPGHLSKETFRLYMQPDCRGKDDRLPPGAYQTNIHGEATRLTTAQQAWGRTRQFGEKGQRIRIRIVPQLADRIEDGTDDPLGYKVIRDLVRQEADEVARLHFQSEPQKLRSAVENTVFQALPRLGRRDRKPAQQLVEAVFVASTADDLSTDDLVREASYILDLAIPEVCIEQERCNQLRHIVTLTKLVNDSSMSENGKRLLFKALGSDLARIACQILDIGQQRDAEKGELQMMQALSKRVAGDKVPLRGVPDALLMQFEQELSQKPAKESNLDQPILQKVKPVIQMINNPVVGLFVGDKTMDRIEALESATDSVYYGPSASFLLLTHRMIDPALMTEDKQQLPSADSQSSSQVLQNQNQNQHQNQTEIDRQTDGEDFVNRPDEKRWAPSWLSDLKTLHETIESNEAFVELSHVSPAFVAAKLSPNQGFRLRDAVLKARNDPTQKVMGRLGLVWKPDVENIRLAYLSFREDTGQWATTSLTSADYQDEIYPLLRERVAAQHGFRSYVVLITGTEILTVDRSANVDEQMQDNDLNSAAVRQILAEWQLASAQIHPMKVHFRNLEWLLQNRDVNAVERVLFQVIREQRPELNTPGYKNCRFAQGIESVRKKIGTNNTIVK